jgi:hypothetical protein
MAYVALVVIAFTSGSLYWADTIFTCAIAILLVATTAAVFVHDGRQVFWRGFCLIGWIYMFLAFGPWTEGNIRSSLMTHHALEKLQRLLAPIHASRYATPGFEVRPDNEWRYQIGPNSYFETFQSGSWQATQRTGHSVWAVILGLIGGFLAVHFNKLGPARKLANS